MLAGSENVLNKIDEDFLTNFAMDFCNIASPTGQEKAAAEFLAHRFEDLSLKTTLQEVEKDRSNVVGMLEGESDGPTLMLCGHIDTSYPFLGGLYTTAGMLRESPKAFVDGDWIYGTGVYNMKGAMAAFVAAVDAIQKSRIKLRGDVIIAGVVGEIEKAATEEYSGPEYRGYGHGTRYLVTHGYTADMCIIGEATNLRLVIGNAGSTWVKITTKGTAVHTAYRHQPDVVNAIEKMMDVLEAIRRWIPEYEAASIYKDLKPCVNISSIEGGWPWRASRTPSECSLYLDIRRNPRQTSEEVRYELKQVLNSVRKKDPSLIVDMNAYVTSPSAEVRSDEPIVKNVYNAHKSVYGSAPPLEIVGWYSDAGHFINYGIPAINYGAGGSSRTEEQERKATGMEFIKKSDLVAASKVYALATISACNTSKRELLQRRAKTAE